MTDIYPKYRVQKAGWLEWEVRRQGRPGGHWHWESDHLTKLGAILKAKSRIGRDELARNPPAPVVVWGPEP